MSDVDGVGESALSTPPDRPVRSLPLRLCAGTALCSLFIVCTGLVLDSPGVWQPAAVLGAVALPLALRYSARWQDYQFTAWILTTFVVGMIYPQVVGRYGPIDLHDPRITLLGLQLVMFGMGTQMSLRDFAGVLKSPYGVLIGMACQYTIMPLTGWTLARTFPFEPEVAAGLILVGSCSSGLASNVMTYIAKANVALSITMTAVATLLAPVVTPAWMKLLAGTLVEVDFIKMMTEIMHMVIIPILAALIDDYKRVGGPQAGRSVWGGAILGAAWLMLSRGVVFREWEALSMAARLAVETLDGVAGAFVFGLLYHYLVRAVPQLSRWMPWAAMLGIVYVVLITTVKGRDNLLLIGPLLFVAVAIHNAFGYVLGYWLSRLARLDPSSARTVAIEVGLQNGGMAAGLAAAMGKMGTVGLAAAIFAPWMSISGSILANYWGRRPVAPGRPDQD